MVITFLYRQYGQPWPGARNHLPEFQTFSTRFFLFSIYIKRNKGRQLTMRFKQQKPCRRTSRPRPVRRVLWRATLRTSSSWGARPPPSIRRCWPIPASGGIGATASGREAQARRVLSWYEFTFSPLLVQWNPEALWMAEVFSQS